jgi:hypothetical protein
MARMYPSAIADDHGSRAERTVFRKLRDETPDSWLALHSVGLINHARKPWAELDFVLITDAGIVCLEVKGGTIVHRGGDWHQNEHRLKESPFAQAGGGASALYEYLADRVPAVRRSFVGHGVLFPESSFHFDLPSTDRSMVFDDDDLGRPMSVYIERLLAYWTEAIGKRWGRAPEGVDRGARSLIVHELAPDFELIPSLRSRLSEVDDELIRLTVQQVALLRGLVETPRVIVRGGAGTGKTVIACEEATRLAGEGCRTLYVCYSSRLAAHVRPALADVGVATAHLHGLMRDLVLRAGLERELPAVEERDLFDVHYPSLALDALAALDEFGSYDALVIDEGQDILKEPYVPCLDALLAGELRGGTWRLFHDPNQDIFRGGAPAELERLEGFATCYRLTQNCRNTREIAMATSILSGVAMSETLVAEGPAVVERWHDGERSEQKEILRVLRDWIDRGVQPSAVTILSPRRFEGSSIARIERSRLPRQIVDVSHSDTVEPNCMRFSTVAGFKGLESEALLLTGFVDLEDPRTLGLLYVGASRARALLALVLSENCREAYVERARDVVGRLIGA